MGRGAAARPMFRWYHLGLPAVILVLQLLFLLPMLCEAAKLGLISAGILDSDGLPISLWKLRDCGAPLLRTLTFALAATCLQLGLGFFVALHLDGLSERYVGYLRILLLPALLGNAPVGFLFRGLPMFIPNLFHRDALLTWATLLAIETWQYTPMWIYLFMLRLRTQPEEVTDFIRAAKLSRLEYIRIAAWPHCRHLAFVLVLFSFLQAVAEATKTSIIFKASAGTQTEFISHWISSHHRLLDKQFVEPARSLALGYSGVFLIATVIAALITAILVTEVMRRWIDGKARLAGVIHRAAPRLQPRNGIQPSSRKSTLKFTFLACALILIVLWPFAQLVCDFVAEIGHRGIPATTTVTATFVTLLSGLPWALLATFLISVMTIVFGIVMRLVVPYLTESFNHRSRLPVIFIILLHSAPALGLAYCVFYWFHVMPSASFVRLLWVMAQAVFGFSVVATFILSVHFGVSTEEIRFYQVSSFSLWEAARVGFVRRFKLNYALVVLFALSLVLNEDVISGTLSNYVEAPILTLERAAVGPGANYERAMIMVIFLTIVTIIITFLWNGKAGRLARRQDL